MKFNERVPFETILAQNPEQLWIFIHIAWGAIYSAMLIVALLIVSANVHRSKQPIGSIYQALLFSVQVLFSLTMLAGVFVMPILVGLVSKEVLIKGTYSHYLILSIVTCLLTAWWLLRDVIDKRLIFGTLPVQESDGKQPVP